MSASQFQKVVTNKHKHIGFLVQICELVEFSNFSSDKVEFLDGQALRIVERCSDPSDADLHLEDLCGIHHGKKVRQKKVDNPK